MSQFLRGCYRDVLIDSPNRNQWDSGWRSNLIVRDCNRLLSALMGEQEGIGGIQFMALGEGDVSWDQDPPRSSWEATRLTNEVRRRFIEPSGMVYLDPNNQPASTVTTRLQVTTEFSGQEGPQTLREFALFGGNATENLNSGFMIDRIIHPRIDLDPGMTLVRHIRLSFTSGVTQTDEPTEFGAAMPVSNIDGVGEEYAASFARVGIFTLTDLANTFSFSEVEGIHPPKLREFRAKAMMVLGLRLNLGSLNSLAEQPLTTILSQSPQVLMELQDSSEITVGMIQHLQDRLSILEVALDHTLLQQFTLGAFLEG